MVRGTSGGARSSRVQQASMARGSMGSLLMLMLSFFACFYTAGRLWQDAEMTSLLVRLSKKHDGQESGSLSVDETMKLLDCKEQQKRLADLEMELTAAKSQGYMPKYELSGNITKTNIRYHAVVGISTSFGSRSRRDAIRKSWMPTGAALKKLEEDKGIVIRFVIGRSANRGDLSDRQIDQESKETNGFLILDNHVEDDDLLAQKTKLYFSVAVDLWDSDFYLKVDDDVFVNIDKLGTMLATHWDNPRAYVGCMKSGEVVSDSTAQWYEPEWWKFGEEKSQYFRHASGQIYALSRVLAQYISINSASLHEYKNEDVSVGAWLLGIHVEHIDEIDLCCSTPSTGGICATGP